MTTLKASLGIDCRATDQLLEVLHVGKAHLCDGRLRRRLSLRRRLRAHDVGSAHATCSPEAHSCGTRQQRRPPHVLVRCGTRTLTSFVAQVHERLLLEHVVALHAALAEERAQRAHRQRATVEQQRRAQ